jgi:hypothetical protein
MGNSSSKRGGATAAAAAAFAPSPEFSVWILPPSSSSLAAVTLRLEPEVLLLLDAETQSQVYQVYYFRIVCWGYNASSFHWKAYASEEDAAEESEATVVTYTLETGEGAVIERALMGSVRALMGRMESKGVSGKDFAALLRCLHALAADGLTDHALATVKQMALARKFDARQATELVNVLGTLSPFEKIEGACALYPGALLHPASLPTLLLDCFEDSCVAGAAPPRTLSRGALTGASFPPPHLLLRTPNHTERIVKTCATGWASLCQRTGRSRRRRRRARGVSPRKSDQVRTEMGDNTRARKH